MKVKSWGMNTATITRFLCNKLLYHMFTAIVGAGVGGTSAAFFLRELFRDNVVLDIFEKHQVGGRLAQLKISGHYYNAGGTIIHPQNMYMVNFTDMLGKLIREKDADCV